MNIITTERLTLSHVSSEDAEFILELLNTPGWIEFIGNKNVKTLPDAENYIQRVLIKSYEEFGFGLYLVKLKAGNIPIGICGLIKRKALEDVDIGFAVLPSYSGKGYAYESAAATLSFAKTEFGLKKIAAITNKDNVSSIRLLEKIGLKFEKTIIFPGEEKELMLFATSL
ncbi:MAG: GNAT family N-acetyltransferase [Ignavibacteria bacterium]|nr:GNAT family N-acetyltransferase [Ignavibacteria bacterium]